MYTNNLCNFRAATAALVEKQSHEMLELINEKRSEYMQAESLYLDQNDGFTEEAQPYPVHAPPPAPPALSKFQVRRNRRPPLPNQHDFPLSFRSIMIRWSSPTWIR